MSWGAVNRTLKADLQVAEDSVRMHQIVHLNKRVKKKMHSHVMSLNS